MKTSLRAIIWTVLEFKVYEVHTEMLETHGWFYWIEPLHKAHPVPLSLKDAWAKHDFASDLTDLMFQCCKHFPKFKAIQFVEPYSMTRHPDKVGCG